MKNTKSKKALFGALVVLGAMALATAVQAGEHPWPPQGSPPPGTPPSMAGPEVFVTGQDAIYTTIILGPLPMDGPFQLLEMDGPTGLQTEFGPGDPGYLGGRWWVDLNGNQQPDEGDAFFMCPLTGPGEPNT